MATPNAQSLLQQLAALVESSHSLNQGLAQAAQDGKPNVLPPARLMEQIAAWWRDFAVLREEAQRLAAAQHVAIPSNAADSDPVALQQLLEEVARHEGTQEMLVQALAVLDRVMALTHRDQISLPALDTYQAQAYELRRQLSNTKAPPLPPEVAALVEHRHPLSALLLFIDHPEKEIPIEQGIELEEIIEQAFGRAGKELRLAARRHELTARTDELAVAPPAPPPSAAANTADLPSHQAPVLAETRREPAGQEPEPPPQPPPAPAATTEQPATPDSESEVASPPLSALDAPPAPEAVLQPDAPATQEVLPITASELQPEPPVQMHTPLEHKLASEDLQQIPSLPLPNAALEALLIAPAESAELEQAARTVQQEAPESLSVRTEKPVNESAANGAASVTPAAKAVASIPLAPPPPAPPHPTPLYHVTPPMPIEIAPSPEPPVEEEEAEFLQPAQLLYQFHRADTAQRIAATLLEARAAALDPPKLRDLIWRLIYEDRLALAYHLATPLEKRYRKLTPQLAPALLQALALSRYVRYESGEIANLLRGALPNADQGLAAGDSAGEDDWNLAVNFLLLAATLRPLLLVPHLPIPAALLTRRLPDGFPHLYACHQAVLRFATNSHQALNPLPLKEAKKDDDWQRELSELQDKVQKWLVVAPKFDMKYGQAKAVWCRWVGGRGLIGEMLRPIIEKNASQATGVKKTALELMDEDEVARKSFQTNLEIHKGMAAHIVGDALEAIWRYSRQAAKFALDWNDLQEADPTRPRADLPAQAKQLRDEFVKHQVGALAELQAFAAKADNQHHGTPYVLCGLAACQRALENLAQLFARDIPLPADEPDPKELLNADLLRMPEVPMNEYWQSELTNRADFIRALVELLRREPFTWPQAFAARQERDDHEATQRIIEYLTRQPQLNVNLAELRDARTHHLRKAQEEIKKEAEALRRQVVEALEQNWLGEQEQVKYFALAETVERALELTLRLYEPKERLRKAQEEVALKTAEVRAELEERRQAIIAFYRKKVEDERPNLSAVDYERIVVNLNQGDLATANEYLEMARRSDSLPPVGTPIERFDKFFPKTIREILSFLSYHSEPKAPEKLPALLPAFTKKGKRSNPLPTLNETQAAQAGKVLKAWFAVKQQGQVNLTEKPLDDVLAYLGFDSPIITQRQGGPHGFTILTKMRSRVLHHHIAAYGSGANNNYRLHCAWGNPSPDELLNLVDSTVEGSPAIVLYFGCLEMTQRQKLARLCIQNRRTFLLIDDALLFYLCHLPAPRLPVLFDCALPFTYLGPYNPDVLVLPEEMFFGRQKECDQILDRHDTCLIYGGRRFGKTSLLHEVQRRFNKRDQHEPLQRLALYFDVDARLISTGHLPDQLWDMLAAELSQERIIERNEIRFGEKECFADLMKAINRWLGEDAERRLLFLLDEAGDFLALDRSAKFPITKQIRELMRTTNNRCKAVLCGSNDVLRAARDKNQPLAHLGAPLCIGPLLGEEDKGQARELIKAPFASLGYRFESPDLITRILSRTGFYPNLIQLYCKQLLEHVVPSSIASLELTNTPPYTISSRHVEAAYQDDKMQERIRDYFLWTLDLDKRYLVIAHAIALYSIPTSGMLEDHLFSVSWILEQARTWWPAGFRDSDSPEQLRVLLNEMVELGVLRREDGQYALRSPNMTLLLGTKEELETTLMGSVRLRPPLDYEAATFRTPYATDPPRRSPLTMQQVFELRERRSAVSLLFGAAVAGLDELHPFLNQTLGSDHFIYLDEHATHAELMRSCADLPQRAADETTLLLVSPRCAWDESWVQQAVQSLSALTEKGPCARITFVADPAKAWHWCGASQTAPVLASEEVSRLRLTPWHESVLCQWLDNCGFRGATEEDYVEIARVTNNWPALLYRLYALAKEQRYNWRQQLQTMAEEMTDPTQADRLANELGLTLPVPRRVLRSLAIIEHASSEELAGVVEELDEFTGGDAGRRLELVRQSLKWAELLGLVSRTATPGARRWQAIPLVSRLLSSTQEP